MSSMSGVPKFKKIEKITDLFDASYLKRQNNQKERLDYLHSDLIQVKDLRLANLPKQLRGFENGVFIQRRGNFSSVLNHFIHKDANNKTDEVAHGLSR